MRETLRTEVVFAAEKTNVKLPIEFGENKYQWARPIGDSLAQTN